MKTSIYPKSRKGFFFSLLFLSLFSVVNFAYGQVQKDRAPQEFHKLGKAYQAGKFPADKYLIKADSLIHQFLSEGKSFETKELVNLLSLYEDIAWGDPKYSYARKSYYYLFFNNARMFKKKGASMYYAEKVTEEYKREGENNPLIEQLQKCKMYQEQRLYDKVIAVFEKEEKYITSLPELIKKDKVDLSIALNAMYVLSPTLTGYIKQKDSAKVLKTADLTRSIGKAIQSKYPLSSRSRMLYNDLLLIDMEHSLANYQQNYQLAGKILDRMEGLKKTYSDQAANFIDINVVRMRIENFFNLKKPDSLAAYISKYEHSPNFGKSQSADLEEYKAKLQAIKGNYQGAYSYLTESIQHERNLQGTLMAETSDLLYAYTQAEHSDIALQKTELVKQQRTKWLVIISIAATLLILLIYLLMVYRSRKAKAQIVALNQMADMQIIAMEEAKHEAVKEEQQRLGQDLHDGLSSSMAAFTHQLEVLSMDVADDGLRNKFNSLRTEMVKAYETVRSKSHDWFSASDKVHELSFENQIQQLAESSLPGNRYQKQIHIDDTSLTGIGTDTRIVLLRVIQEAITNIIKHAKAKKVEILIYQDEGQLVLNIIDDGVGLSEKRNSTSKSLGLESIRRRVQYLNGEMKISSDGKGTEIVVTIPLVDH
ncbi:sensor histidine kinase [Pedobacter ureilyticus]|uniref:Oxygen sensor histidine kinase NreB n=1 Tax=Pedobacter ureilyticus TaxID=1393051 RepID=A0ABW9JEP3_9SPHI|nr:ATP-binding protein [Pedobacter helvus]